MREQFVKTTTKIFDKDNRIVLLLGDIGVYPFKQLFQQYPNRAFNMGILEQSMIGVSSGLALEGLIPIVYTIAPFITSRVHEQLKLDLGYQKVNVNIVSIGGSYDYSSLGCTHQSPEDVGILKQIPNFEIVVPGNSDEFDKLFSQSYISKNPTYFRLCEKKYENPISNIDVKFGKANIIKKGKLATVITVGNLLDKVIDACWDKDVTILYYTTLSPFDYETLKHNLTSNKILLCEPYYYGGLTNDIVKHIKKPLRIEHVGMPIAFLDNYGTKEEHDEVLGFTSKNIRDKLESLIHE